MDVNTNSIKQRYGIIGLDPALDRAIEVAVKVAQTDLSVLVTGESGAGKENFPRIIHDYSSRKGKTYIPVNCGAIPQGTIDSELFGHEKGAFTGANETRKGFFEEADGGTIFLDEVADLPLETQIRLLRVLENGEFIRVGSARVMHTDVRVVAATNVNIADRISKGKFREDLFYRLNSVSIRVPALRERRDDIHPLFMKFATEFSHKYHIPPVTLDEEAIEALKAYNWPGNVRQLKHTAEQISLIEKQREISADILKPYLTSPKDSNLPALIASESESYDHFQKEIIFKFIAELQREISELKHTVNQLANGSVSPKSQKSMPDYPLQDNELDYEITQAAFPAKNVDTSILEDSILVDVGDLTMESAEIANIKKALQRHGNNRKLAAQELGISERTLYRKIKEYGL